MFASQFEDESIAAVERGDIDEALMIAQQGRYVDSTTTATAPTAVAVMSLLSFSLSICLPIHIDSSLFSTILFSCTTCPIPIVEGVKLLEHPDHINAWSIRYCAGNTLSFTSPSILFFVYYTATAVTAVTTTTIPFPSFLQSFL